MKIAVSACLLGEPCRYDGASKPCTEVEALKRAGHELVPVCPEAAGGLAIPRPPCEITSRAPLRVQDSKGYDRTEAFELGARKTVRCVREAGCEVAVLKAKSPSCGSGLVYDGTFSGTLVPGWGIAARLLRENGVRVMDETQAAALL